MKIKKKLICSAILLTTALSAQTNALPDNGYFFRGKKPILSAQRKTGRVSLKKERYEKGTAILVLNNIGKKENTRFGTQDTPITGNLMVFEVMARCKAKIENPRFEVMAVAARYKYITHKRFNLTSEWRKYVAVVEVPKDPKNEDIFCGLIDIPAGCSVEIGRIAIYTISKGTKITDETDDIATETKKKFARGNVNMLPDNGYFFQGKEPILSAQRKTGSVSLKKERYEKGTAILVLNNIGKKENTRFGTQDTPITGNLMVFEVMARCKAKIENPRFEVMAVAARYKYITHKRFNLTSEWRKYVAVVEVPKDPKNEDIFCGLIDIPAGCSVEIGRIAIYSTTNDTRIAGMADDIEAELKKKQNSPTINESKTPIPSAKQFITSQVGNKNPFRKLESRLSSEIKCGNISGAALCGAAVSECPTEGSAFGLWSPWWVIADPGTNSAVVEKCFSGHIRVPYASGDTLTIRWKKPVKITQVKLIPRFDSSLYGFPIDWHLDISSDGKTFKEVAREKNFNKIGVRPLISFPEQDVIAIRWTSDKNRPENKYCGYMQLRRVEALTKDGTNVAYVKCGASAETSCAFDANILNLQYYYDSIVRCGIKTVIVNICYTPGGYNTNSIRSGIAMGSRGYKNLTSLIRFLKENGVETIIRLEMNLRRRPADQLDKIPLEFSQAYLKHIRSWKGLVSHYTLGNEENQYRVGKKLGYSADLYKKAFNDSVIACCKEIRKIDPNVKISVATALFDFDWTEGQLKYGVSKAGLVDTFSVHIYRESDPIGSYPEKCYSFFVDGRRGLESERMFTRAEDEIKAYRKMLDKYNPKLNFSCEETCMRAGKECRGMITTELGQAKYVSRQFIMHQFYGIGPTLWWAFISGEVFDGIHWGMVRPDWRKNPAWDSYRYFNAVFDNSWVPDKEFALNFTPNDKRFYSYTFKRGKEWMAAFWIAVSMRDQNTGKQADILIPGKFDKDTAVECIDLLNGGIQKMNVTWTDKGLLLKNVIVRDYALVFRPVLKGFWSRLF